MAFVANVLNSSALRSCIDSDIATVIKAVESDVEWKEGDQSRLCLNAICQYCSDILLLLFFYLLGDKTLAEAGRLNGGHSRGLTRLFSLSAFSMHSV